jgi:hypothetical protein
LDNDITYADEWGSRDAGSEIGAHQKDGGKDITRTLGQGGSMPFLSPQKVIESDHSINFLEMTPLGSRHWTAW